MSSSISSHSQNTMPPYGIRPVERRVPARPGAGGRAAVSRTIACMLIVTIVTNTGCDASASPHRGTPVVVDDTLLRYPDSSTFAPGLHDLRFIGQLPAESRAPFVVVAGRDCNDCDAPPVVIVRAPADGPLRNPDEFRSVHPYPGRPIGAGDSVARTYSRLFWGDCLPQRPPGVVSYRTDFGAPGDEPLREMRITEVHGDSVLDWRMVPEVRILAATLLQVRARRCAEVPPDTLTPL